LTTEQFLLSLAYEMHQCNDPYAPIVSDPKQAPQVCWSNVVQFLESQPERWLIVLDDFHKTTDTNWDELLQFFDLHCRRTKPLVTTRKEPKALHATKSPMSARKIFDVPELPKEEATATCIWENAKAIPSL
jgi:hypothetical protein